METSDNNASSSPAPRRSGRARVAPQKFSPEPHPSQNGHASSSKRKRSRENDGDDDEDEDDNENEDEAENEEPRGSDDDVPTDEEHGDVDDDDEVDVDADDEPARRSKKSRSSQKSRSKKPAAKRAKVNGAPSGLTPGPLAVPAVRLPNRPKKTTKVAPASLARRDENDLYCENHTEWWRPAFSPLPRY